MRAEYLDKGGPSARTEVSPARTAPHHPRGQILNKEIAMTNSRALLAVFVLMTTSACAAVGPIGGLYAGVRAPGQFVAGETTNPGGSAISGESCASSILGLVAFGDYSIDSALKAAGAEGKTLKNVAVDGSIMNILGIYQKFCTTVNAHVAM